MLLVTFQDGHITSPATSRTPPWRPVAWPSEPSAPVGKNRGLEPRAGSGSIEMVVLTLVTSKSYISLPTFTILDIIFLDMLMGLQL